MTRATAGGDAARDRGSADAIGIAIIGPAAIALALVVLFLGRQVDSRATVHGAAESAAQAAARERTPAAAVAAARRVGAAMLTDPTTCGSPSVAVDTRDFRPGGTVAVTVTCSVGDRGFESIGASSRRTQVTAFAHVDPFRGASP